MTDNLSYQLPGTQELFDKHGDCVLYDIYADIDVISQMHKKQFTLGNNQCVRVSSPTARFIMENFIVEGNNRLLAYFADGTLYHSEISNQQMLERFAAIAAKKGFPVRNRIAVPVGFDTMLSNQVGCLANQKYPSETNLIVEPVKAKDEFIDDIFADGNICLTAAKTENIDAECREYLALFADGRFIVSEKYKPNTKIYDRRKVNRFVKKYPQYVYFQIEYVPDDYIAAIYEKATEYDWFGTPQKKQIQTPSAEEIERIRKFYDENLKGVTCLSVTIPSRLSYSPEEYHYALFKNGMLLLDKAVSAGAKRVLLEELQRVFPELNFKIYRVPQFGIPEIYKAVLKVQKSARQIYMEMLKQKARKLKKMLNVPHHDALETVARMSGWDNWKQVTKIDESRARFVIYAEKENKQIANELHFDQIEFEYKEYLKKQA